ncbi:MAG TPA: Calx-beta domain-containing protein, partial [Pirellulaceae bacterium]
MATITVAINPPSVLEDANAPLEYTFTRTGSTAFPLTIGFNVAGTAGPISDFSVDPGVGGSYDRFTSTGTVTFGAGQSTATVRVTPYADNLVENEESVIITIGDPDPMAPTHELGTPSSASGDIEDDENTVSLTVSPPTVVEDQGAGIYFTFSRTGSTFFELTVDYTVEGTASNGIDYCEFEDFPCELLPGFVTFAPGSDTTLIVLAAAPDSLVEGDETVRLTINPDTAPFNYLVSTNNQATVTIQDDDTLCMPGTYSSTGNTPCTLADPGFYVPGSGATSQIVAPAGTYVPTSGASLPTLASPGYYVPSTGATSQTPASPGYYVPEAGATSQIEAQLGS